MRSSSTGFAASRSSTAIDVYLQSRGSKPLQRYFPELAFPAGRYVLDGEIVIRDESGREQFDSLQQRIHPAESRIKLLSGEIPATYVAFDLLADGDDSLLELPFAERRAALECLLADAGFADAPIELMASTTDPDRARAWLRDAEGAIAKLRSAPYAPGKRTGMFKVKRVRTIDAVARRLASRQGARHRRRADPRAVRRPGAARRRALLRA